jgi:hypothetical protein
VCGRDANPWPGADLFGRDRLTGQQPHRRRRIDQIEAVVLPTKPEHGGQPRGSASKFGVRSCGGAAQPGDCEARDDFGGTQQHRAGLPVR